MAAEICPARAGLYKSWHCFRRMCSFSLFKKYMLFTRWEVRIEKYFVEVSKTARGRRPRDVFETETKYFSIRTDLNGK